MLHFSKIGNKHPSYLHLNILIVAAHVTMNLVQSGMWPEYPVFYQHTKFGADISIRGRDMPGKQNSKWRPWTAFLWQTGRSTTKLLWFNCFQCQRHLPSCIWQKLILTILYTLGPQCLLMCQIWCRYLDPELRYAPYIKCKMAVTGLSVLLLVLVSNTCPCYRIGQCTL